jgi:hypothetical protein
MKLGLTRTVLPVATWQPPAVYQTTQQQQHLYENQQSSSLCAAWYLIAWISRLVQDDFDPAFALLSEHVTAADTGVRLGAIMGLGLAYASTRREDVSPLCFLSGLLVTAGSCSHVAYWCECGRPSSETPKCHGCAGQVRDLLAPLVTDNDVNIEIAGYAALSLGLVFCGSAEEQCVGVALQVHQQCNHVCAVVEQGLGILSLLQPSLTHKWMHLIVLVKSMEPSCEMDNVMKTAQQIICRH